MGLSWRGRGDTSAQIYPRKDERQESGASLEFGQLSDEWDNLQLPTWPPTERVSPRPPDGVMTISI